MRSSEALKLSPTNSHSRFHCSKSMDVSFTTYVVVPYTMRNSLSLLLTALLGKPVDSDYSLSLFMIISSHTRCLFWHSKFHVKNSEVWFEKFDLKLLVWMFIRNNVLRVVAGEHDLNSVSASEQIRSVKKVNIHPDYDSRNSDSDIAVLEVHFQTAVLINGLISDIFTFVFLHSYGHHSFWTKTLHPSLWLQSTRLWGKKSPSPDGAQPA